MHDPHNSSSNDIEPQMIHVIYYHATKHRKVANPIGKSHICTCTTKWNRNEINNVILNYKIAVCTPVFCFQLTGCGIRTVAFFLSKPAAVSLLEPTTSGHFPVTSGWHDVTSGWYPTVLERHFRCFTIIAHHFRSLPVFMTSLSVSMSTSGSRYYRIAR